MAKAKALQVPSVPVVSLEMTKNEAQALSDLLLTVGGLPQASRRKYVDAILSAFDQLEHFYFNSMSIDDLTGSIEFNGK